MRVIVVGGGISGLVLASSLEKAGIDYVLLEARERVDPQVGASIAMNAASLRVLDQLGAADEIINQTSAIKRIKHIDPKGNLISPPTNDPALLHARFHYQTAFMDRQRILKAMMNSIRQKEKVLTNQRVKSIEHSDKGVTVHCEDGGSFVGDVCIGCDGVNSRVRSEMWRIADSEEPGFFSEEEKKTLGQEMTAEYSCLFGISEGVEEAIVGDIDYAYDRDASFLVISSRDKRVFWFYFEKMSKVYRRDESDFPRFTKEDAERVGNANAWRPCHTDFKFKTLWDKKVFTTLVPMEEVLFDKWSWGRMAVVGDGSHKMTANHGAAGNNAIESAVAMANKLQKINDSDDISTALIRKSFVDWQKKRQARIDATVKGAAMICRMQGLATWKDRLMVYWVMPNASSLLVDMYRDAMVGAEVLEYLPIPDRSFLGTTPFNPCQGIGFEVDTKARLLRALPLFLFWFYLSSSNSSTGFTIASASRTSPFSAAWTRALFYLAQTTLVHALWLTESFRLGNKLSLLQLPILFTLLSQKFSLGAVSPWYFVLHYLSSDVSKFASSDTRLTNVAYTRTLVPVLALAIFAPYFMPLISAAPLPPSFWALTPLVVDLLQWVLVKTGLSKDTLLEDRLQADRLNSDLKWTRLNVCYLVAVSTGAWWFLLSSVSSPSTDGVAAGLSDLSWSWVTVALGGLYWITLLLGDLKRAGMMDDTSWTRIFGGGLVALLVGGPTTVVGLGWWLREEILASRRERNAVVKQKYQGKSMIEVREMLRGAVAKSVVAVNGKGKH